jgi:hypothetical protein
MQKVVFRCNFRLLCSCILFFVILFQFIKRRLRLYCGPGSSVGIATELRAGRSGDRIPVGEIFRTRPDRPWAPPRLLYNGYRVFSGGKAAGALC